MVMSLPTHIAFNVHQPFAIAADEHNVKTIPEHAIRTNVSRPFHVMKPFNDTEIYLLT